MLGAGIFINYVRKKNNESPSSKSKRRFYFTFTTFQHSQECWNVVKMRDVGKFEKLQGCTSGATVIPA